MVLIPFGRMSLRINSGGGTLRSTRQWSCATLHDGVDQLLAEALTVDAQEDALLQMIQDFSFHLYMFLTHMLPPLTLFYNPGDGRYGSAAQHASASREPT